MWGSVKSSLRSTQGPSLTFQNSGKTPKPRVASTHRYDPRTNIIYTGTTGPSGQWIGIGILNLNTSQHTGPSTGRSGPPSTGFHSSKDPNTPSAIINPDYQPDYQNTVPSSIDLTGYLHAPSATDFPSSNYPNAPPANSFPSLNYPHPTLIQGELDALLHNLTQAESDLAINSAPGFLMEWFARGNLLFSPSTVDEWAMYYTLARAALLEANGKDNELQSEFSEAFWLALPHYELTPNVLVMLSIICKFLIFVGLWAWITGTKKSMPLDINSLLTFLPVFYAIREEYLRVLNNPVLSLSLMRTMERWAIWGREYGGIGTAQDNGQGRLPALPITSLSHKRFQKVYPSHERHRPFSLRHILKDAAASHCQEAGSDHSSTPRAAMQMAHLRQLEMLSQEQRFAQEQLIAAQQVVKAYAAHNQQISQQEAAMTNPQHTAAHQTQPCQYQQLPAAWAQQQPTHHHAQHIQPQMAAVHQQTAAVAQHVQPQMAAVHQQTAAAAVAQHIQPQMAAVHQQIAAVHQQTAAHQQTVAHQQTAATAAAAQHIQPQMASPYQQTSHQQTAAAYQTQPQQPPSAWAQQYYQQQQHQSSLIAALPRRQSS
ncbi:hypothetical protein CVT26_004025 [Gymnopilus dilepis]|uniref:Uncharacterized protein n=1 Tax=Gymnopilus dilepis TaxID=231916 RepID=A0A409X1H1_9AGAR|nr:hypothetical protein CVT26_004025 [Gymnopilus dilepis]